MAVVGASIGANTALMYALEEPRVSYVAMVSPGLDYKGLELTPAMLEVDKPDIFMAAAEQDIYSNLSVELLTDLFAEKTDYEIYQNVHHGNRLINTTPELFHRILRDIIRHLRPDIGLAR